MFKSQDEEETNLFWKFITGGKWLRYQIEMWTLTLLHHTHPFTHSTHTARDSTSCDGSNERLDGDGPGVVPGPDDKHHSQRLWLDVDGVRDGEQVLLHGPRGSPVLQLPDGEADLPLQTQSLVQLGPHLTLGVKTVTSGLYDHIRPVCRFTHFNPVLYVNLKGAPYSLWVEIQIQNCNNYNINEVIIQTYKDNTVWILLSFKVVKTNSCLISLFRHKHQSVKIFLFRLK